MERWSCSKFGYTDPSWNKYLLDICKVGWMLPVPGNCFENQMTSCTIIEGSGLPDPRKPGVEVRHEEVRGVRKLVHEEAGNTWGGDYWRHSSLNLWQVIRAMS